MKSIWLSAALSLPPIYTTVLPFLVVIEIFIAVALCLSSCVGEEGVGQDGGWGAGNQKLLSAPGALLKTIFSVAFTPATN